MNVTVSSRSSTALICPSTSTRAPPWPGSSVTSISFPAPATSGGQTPPWGESGVSTSAVPPGAIIGPPEASV